MAVLEFVPLYMMIGFLLIGFYVARRNEPVALGDFLFISLSWPITTLAVHCYWIADSRIDSRNATMYLRKIFGDGK